MTVIPAINCTDKKCAEARLAVVRSLGCPWVHIDVSDGVFTKEKTLGDPALFAGGKVRVDAHLMVEHPESAAGRWRQVASRITVHIESAPLAELTRIRRACARENVEFGIAVSLSTPVEQVEPFVRALTPSLVHLLAVPVGPAGQKMNERIFERVRFFRSHFPKVPIEVDGGVNPELAKKLAQFGATHVAVASFIFSSKDPKSRYLEFHPPV